jgi:multiple sugar transport system ATP-binding protein
METLVHFDLGTEPAVARLLPQSSLRTGAPLELSVDMGRVHLLDPSSDLVLG